MLVAGVGAGLLGVLGPSAPGAAASAPSNWAVAPSPSPEGLMANHLNAVSCPAAADCVAVGYSSTALGTSALIETLGAGGWALATAPQVPGSTSDELQGVSCVSATSCVAVGSYQVKGGNKQALVETLVNGVWAVAPSPDQGTGNNQLDSVSCPQAGSCAAVGYYQGAGADGAGARRALAEELSGSSWALMAAPNAGSGANVLNGVSCPSAKICFAVGYDVNAGVERALTEGWSNGVWAVTPTPDVGPGANELSSVACTLPTAPASSKAAACASVGTFQTRAGIYQDLIETKGATGWAPLAHSPDANATNNELAAVSCSSPTSCMAVGHHNVKGVAQALSVELVRGAWHVRPSPDEGTSTNDLTGVACAPAAAGCAAVGYFNQLISGFKDVAPQALAEAWSGSSWATVTAADALAPDVDVNDVSCYSSGSCVGVGSDVGGTGARQGFIEDLSDGAWSVVPGAQLSSASSSLDAVSCVSATSCIAVGYYATAKTDQALVEKRSGGEWSVSSSPDEGTGHNQLNGVSCSSPTSCVAVGFFSSAHGPRVLIETMDDGSWALSRSPALSAKASYLESVSCPSPGTCVAVGYDYNGRARRTLVESLANGAWTVDASADASGGDNLLSSVSCGSPTLCVAVGYYSSANAHLGLVETLGVNGWAVTSVPEPSTRGDYPSGVSCTTSGACVLVGSDTGGPGGGVGEALVEAVGIGAWTVVQSPSPDAGGDYLSSVSCVALAGCVAVGHFTEGAEQGALAETGPAPVGVAQTAVTVSSSPNPAKVGQPVTYRATVVPVPVGGTVTFADNGSVVASCRAVPVSPGGKASCSATYSVVGENLVQAAYSGHAGFTPSTSALYSQRVVKPAPLPQGYWLATRNGRVFGAGAAKSLGGIETTPADPVVGISAAPRGGGYWVVTANGTVAAFGRAAFYGDLPRDKVKVSDIVALTPTPNGAGYWLVGRDGGLFAFGNASYHGSVPAAKMHVSDIVGMVVSPGGRGYLLVGADGGVFRFGTSHFYGSLPALHVKVHDVRAILPAPAGNGYLLVGADGGAFLFGHGVGFFGSLPGEKHHVADIVGMAFGPDDKGYFMAGANGAVYGFGDAKVQRAPEGLGAHLPVVAIAGLG